MNELQKIFDGFKEKFYQIEFLDTLQLIWAYVRNLQSDMPIPQDIELPPNFDIASDVQFRRLIGVPEWELDIILFFAILYSPKNTIARYSLKQFNNLGSVVNDIRRIRDIVEKSLNSKDDQVLREFFRLIHRQTPWQERLDKNQTYRYYKIFSHPILESLIMKKVGLTTKELYQIGLRLTVYYNNHFYSNLPIKSKANSNLDKAIQKFVDFFSIKTDEFITKYNSKVCVDEQFLYNFNPMRTHPLLIHKNRLYCPIPTFLFWKVTNGMYYDIVNEDTFANAIGESFEKYCGKVLKKVLTNSSFTIIPEIKYGKPEKRSTDWIVKQNNSYVFIECKAKRLRLGSLTELNKLDDIEMDLKKMIGFIFQVYKRLIEALNNKIPNLKLNDSSNLYVVVLTLEEWFLPLNFAYEKQIKESLYELFEKNHLDKSIIEKYPYYLFSMSKFELESQIININGIDTYFEYLKENKLMELKAKFDYYQLFESEFNNELIRS